MYYKVIFQDIICYLSIFDCNPKAQCEIKKTWNINKENYLILPQQIVPNFYRLFLE